MSVLKNLSVISGVFLVVFVLGLVSAQNDFELPPQSDLESMKEFQELLRDVQLIFEKKIASKVRHRIITGDEDEDGKNDDAVDPNGCSCSGLMCSCCKLIIVRQLHLNGSCCLNVTYLPRHFGILITLTFGSRKLCSKEISASKPPPVCIGIPHVEDGGQVCIQFYNLSVNTTSFRVCSKFLAKVFRVTILTVDIGCFHINFRDANQQVGEVDLPHLDVPQGEGRERIYLGEVLMQKIKPAGYKEN